MNGDEVRELESVCETALEAAVSQLKIEVSNHTVHMMAKAAVAVLEATQEASQG